jgi:hypothetical protein
LNCEKVTFHKNDSAFLSVSNPPPPQAASERFTAEVIRKRLDYTGRCYSDPSFPKRERAGTNLRRFNAVSQIEYCPNLIFKRIFRSARSLSAVVK